jgi:TnpA family transposase
VPATGIMRTLQVGESPTRLAQGIAEFGRIDKTLHSLTLHRRQRHAPGHAYTAQSGEGRHSVARVVFNGKRGEVRQR